MLLGVHTCWLEPLVPLLRYQMFLIFVSHVSCHFSWIIPKSSLYFFIGNGRYCRSSKSSKILPLFYHHCIPRLIYYQNIAFLIFFFLDDNNVYFSSSGLKVQDSINAYTAMSHTRWPHYILSFHVSMSSIGLKNKTTPIQLSQSQSHVAHTPRQNIS